jgi:hypothetical protein
MKARSQSQRKPPNHERDDQSAVPVGSEAVSASVSQATLQRVESAPSTLTARDLLSLQRMVGNRATEQVLARHVAPALRGGEPLPEDVRGPMEQSFGADFGRVHVHADERSDVLNRALDAEAFTSGEHIFFRRNRFRPHSVRGHELLAHELTHVVQQAGSSAATASGLTVGPADDAAEREADRVARSIPRRGVPSYLRTAVQASRPDSHRYRHELRLFRRAHPDSQLDRYDSHLGETGARAVVRESSPLRQIRCKGRGKSATKPTTGKGVFDVPAKADAPKSFESPQELTTGMSTAWKGSFPGGLSQEQGGLLVRDDKGNFVWKAGVGDASGTFKPDFGAVAQGETMIGSAHTHPYTKTEAPGMKNLEDVSFSGDDLSTMILTGERACFVQAGKSTFTAIRTEEFDARLAPLNKQEKLDLKAEMEKYWQDTFDAAKGDFQKRVETAAKGTCDKYDLVYYKGKGGKSKRQ